MLSAFYVLHAVRGRSFALYQGGRACGMAEVEGPERCVERGGPRPSSQRCVVGDVCVCAETARLAEVFSVAPALSLCVV